MNILERLVQVANKLDSRGLHKDASKVDGILSDLVRTAQRMTRRQAYYIIHPYNQAIKGIVGHKELVPHPLPLDITNKPAESTFVTSARNILKMVRGYGSWAKFRRYCDEVRRQQQARTSPEVAKKLRYLNRLVTVRTMGEFRHLLSRSQGENARKYRDPRLVKIFNDIAREVANDPSLDRSSWNAAVVNKINERTSQIEPILRGK